MSQKQSLKQTKIEVVTKTSKSNQTVVPVEIRELWGYQGELKLIWTYIPESNEVTVKATPTRGKEWIEKGYGLVKSGKSGEWNEDLERSRNEW